MKNIILIVFVTVIALAGIISSIYGLIFNILFDISNHYIDIISFFIFTSASIIICNIQPIELTQKGKVTLRSAIFFASLLILGKDMAILIALLSIFIISITKRANLKDTIFSISQNIVCIFIAGLVFYFLDSRVDNTLLSTWLNLISIILAIVAYFFLETTLSTLYISTQEKDLPFGRLWRWHWIEILPYYLCSYLIGIIIAVLYTAYFPISSILIILPLFLLERLYKSIKLKIDFESVPPPVLEDSGPGEEELEESPSPKKETTDEIGQLAKKNRILEIVLETGDDLSQSLNLEKIFEIIKEKIQKIISCQTCIIFLIEEIEGEPHLIAKSIVGPYTEFVFAVKKFPILPQETIIACVAAEKKSYFIEDTESQTTPQAMIRYEKSEMAVPLLYKNECVGVVYVGEQKSHKFNKEDLNLLTTIANQAAFSITNAQLYEQTLNMAVTDGLTGLFTHRTFQEKLTEEVENARNFKSKISMVMVDTDHFKEYNDTYGHPDGDVLLKEICKLLQSYVRDTDIVCRYGGDEFSLILSGAGKESAIKTAERIREAIQLRLNTREVKITASIGVASFPDDATNKKDLIAKADESLYKAKRGGRNMVCYPD